MNPEQLEKMRDYKGPLSLFLLILTVFTAVQTIKSFKELSLIGGDYTPQNIISVSGEGEVYALPDMAEISFSVVETAKTVPEAQKLATDKMNAILEAVKDLGIGEKDIKTTGYNVYPKYEFEKQMGVPCVYGSPCPPYNQNQVLIGYEVSHYVSVKIRDTEKAGDVLAELGLLQATNISGIDFTIDDDEALKDEARDKAIKDAKDKANVLAKSLGVKLVRIVSFSDGSYYPGPVYYKTEVAMDSGGRGGATPAPDLPAGENRFVSNVTIVYEIR